MIDTHKREAFASLSSMFKPKSTQNPHSLRPPYAFSSELFESLCLTCKDAPCVSACEENIIILDNDKIPSLLFTKSGCTFCKECASICPKGVLDVKNAPLIKAQFKISTQTCIAWNSVICNSCADVCDAKAIVFFGMLRPVLDKEKCTACGFCYGVCPTQAVEYRLI